MTGRKLSENIMRLFHRHLVAEEKSTATVEKYLRDSRAFRVYIGDEAVTKEVRMRYKKHLQEKGYAVRSINSMLASVNLSLIHIFS